MRREIAEGDNRLGEAIALQDALTRRHRTVPNMLRLIRLRGRASDYTGAIRDALRLATDERKLPAARDTAYGLAAQAAIDGGEWEELEDIADRWADFRPERTDPVWAEVFALARQRRHGDGLARARSEGLTPTAEANRHLLWAELLAFGVDDVTERLRSLMELSDRFDRPYDLERAFVSAVLTAPESDRPDDPEVVARFQDAIGHFEERYPGAGAVKAIAIPEDADGAAIIDLLAAAQPEQTEEQANIRQDAIDGVRQGRTPIAFLAGIVGRTTAETVVRNGASPLAIFDQATHDEEVAAAERALEAAAASWDETACITIAELANGHGSQLRALIPGSRIGQTVHDLLVDAPRQRAGGEHVATLQIDPDGMPRIYEENPATVARVRDLDEAAAGVAKALTATNDRGSAEDQLAAMVVAGQRPTSLSAVASAMFVARENDLPLYSDDRALRAYARAFGLASFGTLALLDAAQRRRLLDTEIAHTMLLSVIDLGVWSCAFDPDNYVDAARRRGFELESCLRPLLADEAILSVDLRLPHNAELLATVAAEASERLGAWAGAIVDSYRQLRQIDPIVSTSLLVAALLNPDATDIPDERRAAVAAVIAALRLVDGVDASRHDADPLIAGIGRWLAVIDGDAARKSALEHLLGQLNADLADSVRERFDVPGP